MTRLNKQIKSQILANAVEAAGINEECEHIRMCYRALAEDVRLSVIGGVEGEAKLRQFVKNQNEALACFGDEIAKEVLSNACVKPQKGDHVVCNFGGCQIDLYFNGATDYYESKRYEKEIKDFVSWQSVAFPADHTLTHAFNEISKNLKVISDKAGEINVQVEAILNSVDTVKQLLEKWPEAKELIPEQQKPQSTELVVDNSALNEMLKLK